MASRPQPGYPAGPASSSRRGPQASEGDEWGPLCAEEAKPCIPEGEYVAYCGKAVKYPNPRFKREDIALDFKVCEGPHAGTALQRFYSAETAGRQRSHYNREWVIANDGQLPKRGDRMALKKFKGKLFRVRVATVKTDAYQESLPPAMRYSKVAAILELLQTNERPS